jgi:hypothetical protein
MNSTSIEERRKHWKTFSRILEEHLSQKDGNSSFCPEDLVCEALPGETGADWILGNALETILRFRANSKEEDLLKIAALGYVAWLKMGFAPKNETHSEPKKRQRTRSTPKKEEGSKGEAGGDSGVAPSLSEGITVQE